MPYGGDLFSLERDISPPLVQSDLLGSVEVDYSREPSPRGAGSGPTVVTLDDQAPAPIPSDLPEADMSLENKGEVDSPMSAPSTTRERGRPSLSASATSTTPARSAAARTPRSVKGAATVESAGRSTGRKRKAAALESEQEPEPELGLEPEPEPESEQEPESESEPEPAPAPKKRGRPPRIAGAAASARLAAKAAKKPTRGRPKLSTQSTEEPAKKAGRRKKEATANGQVPKGEYEVEEIVDSAIDADTMEHMYLVKWKDYPESDNTWEPKKNLKGALDLVRKFDAKKKKAEAKMASKSTAAAKEGSGSEVEEGKTKPARAARGRPAKAAKPVKTGKGPGRPAGKRRRARA
ncbi:hypothetical protein MFIFM68171_00405 [Madurella fahalii]|uniref:Chromo domain-containing protein n=1 Tax=Madurella fahalii TaxID=1157608 RepID=A0ABQ0FXI3_9PEZI